jgi:Na+/H+-dicarboxylate symporter
MAKKVGLLLLLFWAISFAMVLLLPLAFPHLKSAAFFSTSAVAPEIKVNFLDLYIPSNPFNALANNVVPAVVVFSIMMGIALMGLENKNRVIDVLNTIGQSLIRITNIIVGLTPVGVFAITAAEAGTMTLEEFGRLQVYLATFNISAIFLAFWVLPMMLSSLTPFKYRDVIGLTRDALVTAFTTGNLFIVLTVLTESCKQLFTRYDLAKEKTDTYVDVIIPISFNFPNTGKLLMLLFILFAGWFVGERLSIGQYPTFIIAGLFSFFGGVDVAMPFMLDLMRLPSDLYHLYVVTRVSTGRFATLLAAMNLLIFTLLSTAALTGVMSLNKRKLTAYVTMTVLLTLAMIGGMRTYFSLVVQNKYTKDRVIANMQSMVFPVPRQVLNSVEEGIRVVDLDLTVLERITRSNKLHVGFKAGNVPFSYFSEKGELIGLDVDMAQLLAKELNVDLVFVPVAYDTMADQLLTGHVDLVMSGVAMTTNLIKKMTFSTPYMQTNLAFLVPDYRQDDFSDLEALREKRNVTIGIPRSADTLIGNVKAMLPRAEVDTVKPAQMMEYLERNSQGLDALLLDAERASAWTLLYPQFKVVVPRPGIGKIPLAYPVSNRDRQFADFISQWIVLKQAGGQFDTLYNHWILGKDAEPKTPRWSILRDVLGWGIKSATKETRIHDSDKIK